MIKPIFATPFTRKVVTTAMLATATVAAHSANSDSTLTDYTKTEYSDNSLTRALRAQTIDFEKFDFQQNRRLNKVYLKSCESDTSIKDKKSSLDAIYRVFGTYGATIELQRRIDSFYMQKAIESFKGHFSFEEKDRNNIAQKAEEFYAWQNDVFYTEIFKSELKMYQEENFPSAEKAISVVDNHILNSKFFKPKDVEIYNKKSKDFESKQTNKTLDIAKSDLLAYKVHLLNALAFNNYFSRNNAIPERSLFLFYFNNEFVNGESCIEPK